MLMCNCVHHCSQFSYTDGTDGWSSSFHVRFADQVCDFSAALPNPFELPMVLAADCSAVQQEAAYLSAASKAAAQEKETATVYHAEQKATPERPRAYITPKDVQLFDDALAELYVDLDLLSRELDPDVYERLRTNVGTRIDEVSKALCTCVQQLLNTSERQHATLKCMAVIGSAVNLAGEHKRARSGG